MQFLTVVGLKSLLPFYLLARDHSQLLEASCNSYQGTPFSFKANNGEFPSSEIPRVLQTSDFLFCHQLEKLSAFKGLIWLHQTHRYNFLILKSAEPHNTTNYGSKLRRIHCPWDHLGHASQGDILELCLPRQLSHFFFSWSSLMTESQNQFSSVTQSSLTLGDPMDCITE